MRTRHRMSQKVGGAKKKEEPEGAGRTWEVPKVARKQEEPGALGGVKGSQEKNGFFWKLLGSSCLLLVPLPASSWRDPPAFSFLLPPPASWRLLAPPGTSWPLLEAPPGSSSCLILLLPRSSWLVPPAFPWLLLTHPEARKPGNPGRHEAKLRKRGSQEARKLGSQKVREPGSKGSQEARDFAGPPALLVPLLPLPLAAGEAILEHL